jgi:hypothetical protein
MTRFVNAPCRGEIPRESRVWCCKYFVRLPITNQGHREHILGRKKIVFVQQGFKVSRFKTEHPSRRHRRIVVVG